MKALKLQPNAARVLRDQLALSGSYTAPAGIDPLAQDTSLQIADGDGQIFCTTIPASRWRRTRAGITFVDKAGTVAGGLGTGRFTLKPDGTVLFRAAGRKTHLRTPTTRQLTITLRVGPTCAHSTTAVRPKKTSLVFP
jgi:hypothetical protein